MTKTTFLAVQIKENLEVIFDIIVSCNQFFVLSLYLDFMIIINAALLEMKIAEFKSLKILLEEVKIDKLTRTHKFDNNV